MKILAITQARLDSTRLPEKIIKPVGGKTVLSLHIERIQQAANIEHFLVATTKKMEDDAIVEMCQKQQVNFFRGEEEDVLDRFYQAACNYNPNYVVRLTSDNPLIDPKLIDYVIEKAISLDLDYVSNALEHSFPNGQEVEVFKFSALEKAWKQADLLSEREHVTPYIWKNSSFFGNSLFSSDNIYSEIAYDKVRLTVDEESDLALIRKLIKHIGDDKDWLTYAEYYLSHKKIQQLNSHITRNQGYAKSIKKDLLQTELTFKSEDDDANRNED